jgi:hypothetical protein
MTVYWAIPSRDGRYLALHVGSTSANAWMLERPLVATLSLNTNP